MTAQGLHHPVEQGTDTRMAAHICMHELQVLHDVVPSVQMIRTWSLLLRNAQRQGYMISGRVDPQQLQESPYLMHPVEAGAQHYTQNSDITRAATEVQDTRLDMPANSLLTRLHDAAEKSYLSSH